MNIFKTSTYLWHLKVLLLVMNKSGSELTENVAPLSPFFGCFLDFHLLVFSGDISDQRVLQFKPKFGYEKLLDIRLPQAKYFSSDQYFHKLITAFSIKPLFSQFSS